MGVPARNGDFTSKRSGLEQLQRLKNIFGTKEVGPQSAVSFLFGSLLVHYRCWCKSWVEIYIVDAPKSGYESAEMQCEASKQKPLEVFRKFLEQAWTDPDIIHRFLNPIASHIFSHIWLVVGYCWWLVIHPQFCGINSQHFSTKLPKTARRRRFAMRCQTDIRPRLAMPSWIPFANQRWQWTNISISRWYSHQNLNLWGISTCYVWLPEDITNDHVFEVLFCILYNYPTRKGSIYPWNCHHFEMWIPVHKWM